MHCESSFRYINGDTFQALEIPYKDKALSMVIFLPYTMDGLPEFEQSLTAGRLEQWLKRIDNSPTTNGVRVTLPRFKVKAQFRLDDVLEAMHLRKAFDARTADFSGMAPPEVQEHDGHLYISSIIHAAHVAVDEQGTEAAAAMFVGLVRPMGGEVPPPVVRADHPFLFLIRDNRSGSILFMGRVTDPSK